MVVTPWIALPKAQEAPVCHRWILAYASLDWDSACSPGFCTDSLTSSWTRDLSSSGKRDWLPPKTKRRERCAFCFWMLLVLDFPDSALHSTSFFLGTYTYLFIISTWLPLIPVPNSTRCKTGGRAFNIECFRIYFLWGRSGAVEGRVAVELRLIGTSQTRCDGWMKLTKLWDTAPEPFLFMICVSKRRWPSNLRGWGERL